MSSFRTLFILTSTLTALIPPCLLFLLSAEPFSLPLFGQRHLLPSIISWLILVGDGVWTITSRFARPLQLRFTAVAVFLAFQLSPTIANSGSLPRRLPYQTIANQLDGQSPVYTTDTYVIGEPVSYYMDGRTSVRELPADSELPSTFVVIHRPWHPKEIQQLAFLSQAGWMIRGQKDYTGAYSGTRGIRVISVMRN